jgi:5'-3' exonuclease
MLPGVHLLIDGKNVLYRAVFAQSKDSPVELFFKMIINSATKAGADSFHIFWDCPRKDTWRRAIMPSYKDNRKDSDPTIGEAIGICLDVLKEITPLLGFRQYYCNKLEADDLIYAFSSFFHPTEIVILSSDADLSQITFRFSNARQLKPAGEFVDRPTVNPVLQKCLSGDKSDNIAGYNQIGPVKSAKLLQCPYKLHEFVSTAPATFYFNMNIVDLSLCPYQMRAQKTIIDGMQTKPKFSISDVRNIISKKNMHIPLHNLDWSAIRETIQ